MGFTQTDPQSHESENTWFTPKEFIDILGPFDLDPCSMSFRPYDTAKEVIEHDKGQCGLTKTWTGDVWLNPPYGKQITPFIDKFILHRKGCMLIFARMGSKGIQKLLESGAYVYCLRKRIKFIDKNGKQDTNAGTDSCLVFFDENYAAKAKKLDGILICSADKPK